METCAPTSPSRNGGTQLGGQADEKRRYMPIGGAFREQRGKRLQAGRGEKIERNFAHQFDTGGMDRLYVRGRKNVHKKLLIQAAACNLALLMRSLHGAGKPRAAHDRWGQLTLTILQLCLALIAICQSDWASLVAPTPTLHRRRCNHRNILGPSKSRF